MRGYAGFLLVLACAFCAPAAQAQSAPNPDIDACVQAAAGVGWSPVRQSAWLGICAGGTISFEGSTAPAGSGDRGDVYYETLRRDAGKDLSGFFESILANSKLAPFVAHKRITVIGAHFTDLHLANLEIGDLTFRLCALDGSTEIEGVKLDGAINLSATRYVKLYLTKIQGGDAFIFDSVGQTFMLTQSTLRVLMMSNKGNTTSITISDTLIDRRLDLRLPYVRDLQIDGGSAASAFVYLDDANAIDLEDYQSASLFQLFVKKWSVAADGLAPSLKLYNLKFSRWDLQLPAFPDETAIDNISLFYANWGADPVPMMKSLAASNAESQPALYTVLAKSYEDDGAYEISRQIQFEAENQRAASDGFLERLLLDASWLFAGYGYYPWIGFCWIALFVLGGAVIFKTGERRNTGDYQPRSWLAFSLYSVLPGIRLDDRHSHVAFAGWRQYFLYFLKFLGAVVVVLILSLLKRSLGG